MNNEKKGNMHVSKQTRSIDLFGEGSPLRHPNLFYVGLSNASGDTTPARGGYEEFFWHGIDAAQGAL